MAGNIVHLIGFPGVGKLTIAKEIVRQRSDFVLVDNHLINNPVFSVVNAGRSRALQPTRYCNYYPKTAGGAQMTIVWGRRGVSANFMSLTGLVGSTPVLLVIIAPPPVPPRAVHAVRGEN